MWSLKSVLRAGVTRQHGIKATGEHSELKSILLAGVTRLHDVKVTGEHSERNDKNILVWSL